MEPCRENALALWLPPRKVTIDPVRAYMTCRGSFRRLVIEDQKHLCGLPFSQKQAQVTVTEAGFCWTERIQ